MRYYVACLHTAPAGADGKGYGQDLPAGYALTEGELREIGARAGGAPFTFDHRGVHEAVAIIGEANVTAAAMHRVLGDLAKGDPVKSAIGSVLGAFIGGDGALWCTLVLDDNAFPRINGLIASGALVGVSLTHIPGSWVCVEVALTSDPAREGACIRYGSSDLRATTLYANAVRAGSISSIMSAEPTIASILEGLDAGQRAVVEVRAGRLCILID